MPTRTCLVCILVIGLGISPGVVRAQTVYSDGPRYYGAQPAPGARPPGAATTRPATAPASAPASLKPEELEQVVAPIALYPDSLLAQVLMASTYPLEVVQADRWVKQNPKLKDSPDTLNKLPWDPSVKSLLDFPQVLTMMSEKLDWTVKLGDAFIADQKSLMDAVQRLRGKAYANGNLKSSKEQTVKVEPAAQASAPQVIVVESSSPSVVYVPTYNPTVVYGAWPYPSYPPSYYYPPGYVAGTAMLSFGIGVACGAAWGNAWGGCNWHGGEVDIDVDRNYNFNTNIDREAARANMEGRQGERDTRQGERQTGRDTRQGNRQGGASTFKHDPSHRQGVAYRDRATNEQFRGAQASQKQVAARDAYRGRAETGRQDISRGGADAYRGGGVGAGSSGARAPAGDYRGGAGRQPAASNYSGTRSSGFSGASSGGSTARTDSSRGQASRSSSGYSGSRSSSGGYSGASRGGGGYSGGGGGSRGGGGGGGGRGGGGGGRR